MTLDFLAASTFRLPVSRSTAFSRSSGPAAGVGRARTVAGPRASTTFSSSARLCNISTTELISFPRDCGTATVGY